MWLIVSKFWVPKGFSGITLFPFIIARKNRIDNQVFINHEKIHIRQQLELLVLPFFVWYLIEFFIRLIQYKDKRMAYRNISFEREAYANDKHLNYLNKRKLFAFLRYL